jgi:hypothetical protein
MRPWRGGSPGQEVWHPARGRGSQTRAFPLTWEGESSPLGGGLGERNRGQEPLELNIRARTGGHGSPCQTARAPLTGREGFPP